MPIQFECPACGKKTQAPDEMAGQQARCPMCKQVIDVPGPAYGLADATIATSPAPKSVAKEDDAGRVPCPMCGEMILDGAAKCRYCGEYLDPELRKTQKKNLPADSQLSAGEIVLAILCSGIGCIVGIVWMLQGKPKGLKMFLISICVAVIVNIANFVLQAVLNGH